MGVISPSFEAMANWPPLLRMTRSASMRDRFLGAKPWIFDVAGRSVTIGFAGCSSIQQTRPASPWAAQIRSPRITAALKPSRLFTSGSRYSTASVGELIFIRITPAWHPKSNPPVPSLRMLRRGPRLAGTFTASVRGESSPSIRISEFPATAQSRDRALFAPMPGPSL